jgi:hypothetical protein
MGEELAVSLLGTIRDHVMHFSLPGLGAKSGQYPGRARLAPWSDLRSGIDLNDQVKRTLVWRAVLRDLGGELGEGIWSG